MVATSATPTAAVMDALRRGTEGRDAALLAGLYAEDATLRVVDEAHPPGAPLELRGRPAIAAMLADVCARDMTHRIEQTVVGDGQLAFTEDCVYPDGVRVLCAAVVELRDGKIARQTNVQAWDEAGPTGNE
jgi:ketosteroid isomerase-like protein